MSCSVYNTQVLVVVTITVDILQVWHSYEKKEKLTCI
jgi:hypothetical protein